MESRVGMRAKVMAIAACLVGAALTPTVAAAETRPAKLLDGPYTLVNVNSGKCLEIRGDSTENGAAANQWECNGSNTQKWYFTLDSASPTTIVNANSGKCLEIRGDSMDNGAAANQWECNGSGTQYWWPDLFDSQSWTLTNANSFKCLEIRGDSTDNGAAANQWECNNSNTQKWVRWL
ncbi:RICIN domain-containing protein [Embleya scabrispora]|uniref:RICIN domain-containing protein n=1 Tax=Embleya scabrispora TaxID=159449 RepID=UPI0003809E63|nr:RICIN domain-containing protein [Embleya scabrispora]MYS79181.1 hypothetical protein [Streptomyces sp. SID5474]